MKSLRKLRPLAPYLRRYGRMYAAGIALTLVSSVFSAAGPLLVRSGIDALGRGEPLAFVRSLAALILAFAVLRCWLLYQGRFRIIAASRYVERDLRNDLFRHLFTLPIPFFDRNPTGDLASRLINDVENVRQVAGFAVLILANTTFVFLFGFLAMLWIDPTLALLSLLPMTGILVTAAVTETALHRWSMRSQEKLGEIGAFAQENYSGIRVVKSFVQEEAEIARFERLCRQYRDVNVRFAALRGLSTGGIELFAELAVVVTLLVGGLGMIDGTFTRGNFFAFAAYQLMMIWPSIAFGWLLMLVNRGAACMDRLEELRKTTPEKDGRAAPAGRGEIEIRNLTFSYSGNGGPVLQGISLRIRPGEHVAVVGRIGSGKSTLAALLQRLYDPPRGTVFVDGVDVLDWPLSKLRETIASVPQDGFLFSDTIRSNIELGAGHSLPPERVARLSDLAGLTRDVEGFPGRFEQVIGERGVTLSGGQKQRLSIARALAKDAPVLILDDSFSSVDAGTEQEILNRLVDACRGKTLLLITHRLSTVHAMDRIVVIDDGRLVEDGRHEELLARRGAYSDLFERFVVAGELMKAGTENGQEVG